MQEGWSPWHDPGATPTSSESGRCAWCASGGRSAGFHDGGLTVVAAQLGLHRETLRRWVLEQEADGGARPGPSRAERSRIAELERENKELRRANEILKTAAAFFGAELDRRSQEVVRYVDAHRDRFGVEPICRVLQVAPSSYYAAKRRQPCQRQVRDEALKVEIGRVHAANYGVYGARKVWRQLHRDGVPVARCTVERLMRQLGLAGRTRGTKRRTTIPADTAAAHPTASSADSSPMPRTSCGSPTSPTSPRGPGSPTRRSSPTCSPGASSAGASPTRLRTDLALDALEMAIWSRTQTLEGLVHHSDRGVQYLSIRYTERLAAEGAVTSVGSRGDSYDNAMAESIIGLYKSELITMRGPWRTVDDVELATLCWVHWWNTTRLHSAIGHLPPDEFEAAHYAQQPPANPAGVH